MTNLKEQIEQAESLHYSVRERLSSCIKLLAQQGDIQAKWVAKYGISDFSLENAVKSEDVSVAISYSDQYGNRGDVSFLISDFEAILNGLHIKYESTAKVIADRRNAELQAKQKAEQDKCLVEVEKNEREQLEHLKKKYEG